jgi:phage tail tape-measure protein
MALDNKLKITVEVEGKDAQTTLENIAKATQKTGDSAKAAASGVGVFHASLQRMGEIAGGIISVQAVEGLFNRVKSLGESFLEAAANEEVFVQRMNFALDPMNRYSKAGEQMAEWIDRLALGPLRALKVDDLKQAAITLENFGLSAKDNLIPLANAAAQTGKSIQDLVQIIDMASMGATRGLKQIGIEAGDVFREANRIYQERTQAMANWSSGGVGTFPFRQVVVGGGYSNLQEMAATEQGQADLITGLMNIITERFRGAAQQQQDTWAAMTNALGNYWEIFKERVMGAGLFETLEKRRLDFVNKLEGWMNSGKFDQWAEMIGRAADTAFTKIMDWVDRAFAYVEKIFSSTDPWGTLWADAEKGINKLADAFLSINWEHIGEMIGNGIMSGLSKALSGEMGMIANWAKSIWSYVWSGGFGPTAQNMGDFQSNWIQEQIAYDIMAGRSPLTPALEGELAR